MDNDTRSAYNENERRERRVKQTETLTARWHAVQSYEIATAFISMGGERESNPIRAELQILQQQGPLAAASFSAVRRQCSSHLKYPVL